MSVYLAKLYKFSVEAGVDHDVAEAAAPPPPASEALAVELQRLVPGPRHGPVLRLKNGDLRRNVLCGEQHFMGIITMGNSLERDNARKTLQF